MAVPTFVGAVTGSGNPTCTNSVPSGKTDGDLMLWFITVAYGTVTTPTGWEFVDANSGGALFLRIASSEPTSYSVTVPNVVCRSVMHVWRGVDQADPLMAYRSHTGATSQLSPDNLIFQSCDYMAVSFNGQTANLQPTAPSGWTQAGQQAGSGGGDRGVGGAYKSFTATEGLSGVGNWGGNSSPCVMVMALRADGQTTLSLKARAYSQLTSANQPPFPDAAASSSSIGVSQAPLRRSGDLEVVIYSYKYVTNASPPSFTTPSGFTKKGSDQTYVISAVSPFLILGIGVAYRTLVDATGITVATSTGVAILAAYSIVFSTGTQGPLVGLAANLPGTMGQSSDTSNNTTQDIPAMTLEDLVENNILVAALVTDRGDGSVSAPSGWQTLAAWASANAGNVVLAWFTNGALNSGANPASTTATRSISQYNVAVQFDVARVPGGAVGKGAAEVQAMML